MPPPKDPEKYKKYIDDLRVRFSGDNNPMRNPDVAKRNGESRKGFKHSEESKQKMSESSGRHSYKRSILMRVNNPMKNKETSKKCGDSQRGEKSVWFGKPRKETSIRQYGLRGEDTPGWKGGVATINKKVRMSPLMKQWKRDVFKEDNYTCAWCGDNTHKLNAHHWTPLNRLLRYYNIKSQEEAEMCKELWNLENGITLCKTCHDIVHGKKEDMAGKFCMGAITGV